MQTEILDTVIIEITHDPEGYSGKYRPLRTTINWISLWYDDYEVRLTKQQTDEFIMYYNRNHTTDFHTHILDRVEHEAYEMEIELKRS